MIAIAKFEKISQAQWIEDCKDKASCYDMIKIPTRATTGSAGYDFYSPFDFVLEPGESIKVPTGIRCRISDGWFLMIAPRSSLGVKYKAQLDNTVGIIDGDYYNSKNEGHFFIQITNNSKKGDPTKILKVKAGDRFAQGIFVPFGITVDDDVTNIRTGGFGSTST